jgi:membrane-associated protease RseP (regulator of RpoE activity)
MFGAAAQELPRAGLPFSNTWLGPRVQAVADATGERFIVDARVPTTVELDIDPAQPAATRLETLKSALRERGFTMLRVDNDIRIVPAGSGMALDDEPDQIFSPRPGGGTDGNLLFTTGSFAPIDLSKEIRLQPERYKGRQRGYRVYPRRDGVELSRAGLDPGDLVLSINGHALNDASRGEQVFNEALQSERIAVQIERAGRTEYLLLVRHYIVVVQPRRAGFALYLGPSGSVPYGEHPFAEGDFVTAIDGEPVTDSFEASRKFSRLCASGTTMKLQVVRNGQTLELTFHPKPR